MEYLKICPVCGKSFTTNNELYTYCGPECRVTARRKRERDYRRAERASTRRNREQEEFERVTAEERKERNRKSIEEFERRCNAGDVRALLIREKSEHGNSSRKYWELFAKASIESAEQSGTASKTIVNGHSVYSDTFADDVIDSIQEQGTVIIQMMKRRL